MEINRKANIMAKTNDSKQSLDDLELNLKLNGIIPAESSLRLALKNHEYGYSPKGLTPQTLLKSNANSVD